MSSGTARSPSGMNDSIRDHWTARCECGEVELEATGAPIACVACCCDDCEEAGRRIEALTGACPVRSPRGGTDYVLFRRDRFRVTRGEERLSVIRLREGTPTRRFVASCCNTAMYLGFDRGPFWVTVHRARFGASAPPLESRVQTKFRAPDQPPVATDLPVHRGFPLGLAAKLVASWIPMLLGRR